MNHKVKLFLSVLLVLRVAGFASLHSQSADFIDGKIINRLTSSPVPFATIKLKYNQLGVYANADGDFKLMRNPDFLSDSVIVTCIGFKRFSEAYKDLTETEVNKLTLEPVVYGLLEVKVVASGKKLGSLAIIGRAIRNIKLNYPTQPFNYISYYRDYQKRDGKYINLNEAIIQTLDKGFGSQSISNNYRLLDFRNNMEFPRMEISPFYESRGSKSVSDSVKKIPDATLGDQYGNELFVLMVHDAIRNFKARSFSFIETFSQDFAINHNFAAPVAVYDNNLLLFKIIFNGKTRITGNNLLIKGAIYIQPKNYSIHKIEYSCSYQKGGKALGEMFNVDIEYGRVNDVDSLMCLKYISFNNYFKVSAPDDSTFFRVLRAQWDTEHYINPTLVVDFNNPVDPVSGARKANYQLLTGKKELKINTIQVSGKTVFLRFKEDEYKRKGKTSKIYIQNIIDTDGNLLDQRRSIELYQYRELFVQEYNKPLKLKDSCFMKYTPLERNCRSSYNGNEKYWMNTPVNEGPGAKTVINDNK